MIAISGYPHPTSVAVTAAMKGNRRTETKPEVSLRSALHAGGLRFRKDHLVRTSSGTKTKADVVFTRARVAVFVDGCFWHGCPEHGRVPAANPQYWPAKLARNRERDTRVTAALREDGWTVLRFWEHEPVPGCVERIAEAVRGPGRPEPRPAEAGRGAVGPSGRKG